MAVEIAVVGAGDRGSIYGSFALEHPEGMGDLGGDKYSYQYRDGDQQHIEIDNRDDQVGYLTGQDLLPCKVGQVKVCQQYILAVPEWDIGREITKRPYPLLVHVFSHITSGKFLVGGRVHPGRNQLIFKYFVTRSGQQAAVRAEAHRPEGDGAPDEPHGRPPGQVPQPQVLVARGGQQLPIRADIHSPDPDAVPCEEPHGVALQVEDGDLTAPGAHHEAPAIGSVGQGRMGSKFRGSRYKVQGLRFRRD